MTSWYNISEPFQLNPLKHHLSFIREFISEKLADESNIDVRDLVREIKRIGSSVMDMYTGPLSVSEVCDEIKQFLKKNKLNNSADFSYWAGIKFSDYRTIELSDTSLWMLKYHDDSKRYVHIFPARLSRHSFRVKANTLKSAILYYILIGKDFITRDDLNKARKLLGLSPVKTTADAEAITEMVELIRSE